jgi:hypothetical protein
MSASSHGRGSGWRSEGLDEAFDGIQGGVADFPGEVGVESSGARAGVAEVFLDQPELDAGLQEVDGVGMAEGVDVGTLGEAAEAQ